MSNVQYIGPSVTGRFYRPRGRNGLPTASQIAATVGGGETGQPWNPYGLITGNSQVISSPAGGLNICPYNVFLIPLDNVFTDTPFLVTGTTFWVNFASANTVLAQVKFHATTNQIMQIYPPLRMDGFPFTQFYLSNSTPQMGQTIQIVTILDVNGISPPLEVG